MVQTAALHLLSSLGVSRDIKMQGGVIMNMCDGVCNMLGCNMKQ